MKKSKELIQLAIIIAIVCVGVLISNKLFLRLDFTADKQYTLSTATKDVLKELDDVITVKAYFTKDLPPQLIRSRKDFEDLLAEYESRSGGNIVYEFINPNDKQELEQEAQQNGIRPIMINVQEKDQVKQMRAYMGAVLTLGDKKETVPMFQPGKSAEYPLTTSIKKLSVTDKPKIAFIQGHGEPGLQQSAQVLDQLSILYDVGPYTLTDTAEIPSYYKAIAIVNPTDTIPQSHFNKLDSYLGQGGALYLAYSNMNADLNSQFFRKGNDIGIEGWLKTKGINMGSAFVVDNNSGAITVRQQQGMFMFNSQIPFPFFPIVSKFVDHPAVKGLESLFLPFVTALSYTPVDSSYHYAPLAFSSDLSGLVNAPVYLDINKEWTKQDFTSPNQVLALALVIDQQSGAKSKLVVVPNGQFALSEQGQQLNADNANFASNAVDWLSDDTGLIELRTKGVTSRPIDQVDDTKKELIKYANVVAPIILVLIFAFIRKQKSLKKRQRWIEGNF